MTESHNFPFIRYHHPQGGELEVLKSINWNQVTFDVLCIETEEKFRPNGNSAMITTYLAKRGYVNATSQHGRNSCK